MSYLSCYESQAYTMDANRKHVSFVVRRRHIFIVFMVWKVCYLFCITLGMNRSILINYDIGNVFIVKLRIYSMHPIHSVVRLVMFQ